MNENKFLQAYLMGAQSRLGWFGNHALHLKMVYINHGLQNQYARQFL